MLTDDEQYMKDLTAKCELKAREWDQRSAMRGDELAALSKALGIMTDRVKKADDASVKRAALVQTHRQEPEETADDDEDDDSDDSDDSEDANDSKDSSADSDDDDSSDADDNEDDVSFLQRRPKRQVGDLLRRAQAKHAQKKALLQESPKKEAVKETTKPAEKKVVKEQVLSPAKRQQAVDLLRTQATKLKSAVLSSVLMTVSADPFVKVKKLMQELVERLVTEAADEATQKGWCDTELGKAESSRDTEYTKVNKINANVEALEAARDQLSDEIDTLATELAELNSSLEESTEIRAKEKG